MKKHPNTASVHVVPLILACAALIFLSACSKATIKGGWEGSGYLLVCRDDVESGNYTLRTPSGTTRAGKFELDKNASDEKALRYRLREEGSYDTITFLIRRDSPSKAELLMYPKPNVIVTRTSIPSGQASAVTSAPRTSAREFAQNYLRSKNFNIVNFMRVSAPSGFPEGDGIEYFEVNGAYAGKKPRTIHLAIAPSGDSYRVAKERSI